MDFTAFGKYRIVLGALVLILAIVHVIWDGRQTRFFMKVNWLIISAGLRHLFWAMGWRRPASSTCISAAVLWFWVYLPAFFPLRSRFPVSVFLWPYKICLDWRITGMCIRRSITPTLKGRGFHRLKDFCEPCRRGMQCAGGSSCRYSIWYMRFLSAGSIGRHGICAVQYSLFWTEQTGCPSEKMKSGSKRKWV